MALTRIDHSTVNTFFDALPRVLPYPFPSTSPTVLQATTHCTFLPILPFCSSQKLISQKVQHLESKKFQGYVEFLTALIQLNFIKNLLLLGLVSSFHFSTKSFKAIDPSFSLKNGNHSSFFPIRNDSGLHFYKQTGSGSQKTRFGQLVGTHFRVVLGTGLHGPHIHFHRHHRFGKERFGCFGSGIRNGPKQDPILAWVLY